MATPSAPKAPAPKPSTPVPDPAPAVEEASEMEAGPIVERVSIGGLVIEKTLYPDGDSETDVLKEPEIDPSLIRATRSLQRQRGR